ncbi:MAG: hypothetical protein RLZZ196_416 [Bacteroidota bacterium]|jgi:hypothetical protein
MKLIEILNEIGDASSKPLPWKSKGSISELSKQFAEAIDKQQKSLNWLGPFIFSYSAQSDSASYDIKMEAMGRRRLVLQLPGKPKRKPLDQQYEMEIWISFTVNDSDESTNLNEQYRVMATVIECVQDFISKVSDIFIIKQINILPKSDTGPDAQFDSQRGRLYLAYVKRNIDKLPGKWTAYADEDGISIRNGSWEGGNIVAKSQNT